MTLYNDKRKFWKSENKSKIDNKLILLVDIIFCSLFFVTYVISVTLFLEKGVHMHLSTCTKHGWWGQKLSARFRQWENWTTNSIWTKGFQGKWSI